MPTGSVHGDDRTHWMPRDTALKDPLELGLTWSMSRRIRRPGEGFNMYNLIIITTFPALSCSGTI